MKRKHGILDVLVTLLKEEKGLTGGFLFVIVGAILFALVPPLVLKDIVNELVNGSDKILGLACLYFATVALSGIFDAAKEVLITLFGQKMTRKIRQRMCQKLSMLSAGFYVEHEAGKITSRFVNDVDTVESLFDNGIISIVVDACKLVSILIMIFVMSKGLGILMVLIMPLLFVMTRVIQKKMLQAQLENREAISKVNNHVPETIKNIRMIHTFSKERYMESRYDEYIGDNYRSMEKSNFYDAIYSPIILIISACIIAIMMVCSAMGGNVQSFFGISVGTAVAIIAYVGKVFAPLESIGMEIQNIQSAMAGIRRINEFLSYDERIPGDKEVFTEKDRKKQDPSCIEFNDVVFGYKEDAPIIKHMNLSIQEGEMVTLAGRTGVGKSTAFKLIMGLYDPEEGEVLVYGIPAGQIKDSEKRKLFGYVEQSFRMIPGTIADQICLYDDTISKEEMMEAAKLTGIHETICNFKDGYETTCSQNLFSQGQLQLLSIARAIVKNPKIMLLDEITANLDSDTERKVLDAIEKASRNRTVISISHRIYEKMEVGRMVYLENEDV